MRLPAHPGGVNWFKLEFWTCVGDFVTWGSKGTSTQKPFLSHHGAERKKKKIYIPWFRYISHPRWFVPYVGPKRRFLLVKFCSSLLIIWFFLFFLWKQSYHGLIILSIAPEMESILGKIQFMFEHCQICLEPPPPPHCFLARLKNFV